MHSRIDKIFQDEMQGDTSFQEPDTIFDLIFGSKKYSQHEMRETWESGIKYGIEIGLSKADLEGQQIELDKNTTNERHREFIEKFYKLAEEYKCAIQYHPKIGMVIIDREKC